jgi:hypothetical protein
MNSLFQLLRVGGALFSLVHIPSERLLNPCVRKSVCTHEGTREPLNRFSLNFMLSSFAKICQNIPILVKILTKIMDAILEDLRTFLS